MGGGLTWQLELGAHDLLLQLVAPPCAEGWHAAQHLIQQNAHTPPIHRLAMSLPCHHLWRHVLHRHRAMSSQLITCYYIINIRNLLRAT